ncbi:VWA domain-containing protein [Acidovorax sp.]|uniref:VWA domain-containing protein n=1 Tax=Acidovorax sp. TaxID=1872122 RepID=UPI002619F6B5|nr:VWA domain-containing protein [Acidovorax sp.]
MKTMSLLAAAVLGFASTLAPAQAQNAPAVPTGPGTTMLVLDASGSMWGQIQGRAKIEIAREAVGAMLQNWPRNQQLGLMAYGHRSKGNCADIELLKPPAVLDAASMQQAVNALQPKGMTPISASVRMAAEQLKFTERKATVILVSDGEETCHADPCALGAELEKLGVDFTAHVVGFDLPQGKARAQLQCLAKSTGGRYVEARDAAELNKALGQMAQTAPVAPAKPKVVGNLKPAKGCMLYDQDNFKGESVLLGESGYDNEMPAGWENRVRSLRCSVRSGLYLYIDPNREGEYLMIEDGGERNNLGAVASSYIYFGTFAEEEDVMPEKK